MKQGTGAIVIGLASIIIGEVLLQGLGEADEKGEFLDSFDVYCDWFDCLSYCNSSCARSWAYLPMI